MVKELSGSEWTLDELASSFSPSGENIFFCRERRHLFRCVRLFVPHEDMGFLSNMDDPLVFHHGY